MILSQLQVVFINRHQFTKLLKLAGLLYAHFVQDYMIITHSLSLPPYNHSNIDSDEVLYYVDGDFMSRNHVEEGYISLHPAGIPHGPHPGAMERSIGQTKTDELAVMIDTFAPLKLTQAAIDLSDGKYHKSWLEE